LQTQAAELAASKQCRREALANGSRSRSRPRAALSPVRKEARGSAALCAEQPPGFFVALSASLPLRFACLATPGLPPALASLPLPAAAGPLCWRLLLGCASQPLPEGHQLGVRSSGSVDTVALAATLTPLLGFSPSALRPAEQTDYGHSAFAKGRLSLCFSWELLGGREGVALHAQQPRLLWRGAHGRLESRGGAAAQGLSLAALAKQLLRCATSLLRRAQPHPVQPTPSRRDRLLTLASEAHVMDGLQAAAAEGAWRGRASSLSHSSHRSAADGSAVSSPGCGDRRVNSSTA
jgi:hypothetical protein